jgi:murein L,D-transpeptidase YcbB/YkuD
LRLAAAAALLLVGAPAAWQTPAHAAAARSPVEAEVRGSSDRTLRHVYGLRSFRPFWIEGASLSPAAELVLDRLETAEADGLDPDNYQVGRLREAFEGATRSPKRLARAEVLLSRAFIRYARDLRATRSAEMTYVEPALIPTALSPAAALERAALAAGDPGALRQALATHPIYEQLRAAYVEWRDGGNQAMPAGMSAEQFDAKLRLNLARARALPPLAERYVLVDAAAQRLWMYEQGRPVGSMRVIVGRATEPTPMLAAQIRYAVLNPYWNVPPDLARTRVAPKVLEQGIGHLRAQRYEVLTDWSDEAKPVDPKKIDWRAVASGAVELPMRQLPGPKNSMGSMKFMFPNEFGVYLHDTPDKRLFGAADRKQSAGCVRVEDARRLARWLFGRVPTTKSTKPEQPVPLSAPVPVYITYLTAAPTPSGIALREDIYGRDGAGGVRVAAGR